MKEITLPKRYGVDDNGKEFGLPEFVTEVLFTRPDLLRDADFCEMVVALMPELKKLHGPAQVGKTYRLSDEHQKRLLACDWTNPRVAQHAPETALAMAHFRLAVKRATDVKEEPASAQTNGTAEASA